jgi:hypothetical protein
MTLSPSLFDKMTVTCTEEIEGGMTITFDWDNTDPVLEPWQQMAEHEKRSFMLTSLSNGLQGNLDATS